MCELLSQSNAVTFGYTVLVFFFNDTATTEIYTLSLHDALPISILNKVNTCYLLIQS